VINVGSPSRPVHASFNVPTGTGGPWKEATRGCLTIAVVARRHKCDAASRPQATHRRKVFSLLTGFCLGGKEVIDGTFKAQLGPELTRALPGAAGTRCRRRRRSGAGFRRATWPSSGDTAGLLEQFLEGRRSGWCRGRRLRMQRRASLRLDRRAFDMMEIRARRQ
jgi:hypothetical protein